MQQLHNVVHGDITCDLELNKNILRGRVIMVLLETAATSMIRNEKTLESFNIETTDKRLSNLFSILY